MVLQITENWQKMFPADSKQINEASLQMHYATQFIAILGKNLLEEKSDDSHTASEWLQEHELLAGNCIKGKKLFRLALDIINYRLVLVDNETKEINSLKLNEKTQSEIFIWLKTQLEDLGAKASLLELKMHYNIPDYKIAQGEPFTMPSKEILIELAKIRHNAHLILNFISSKIKTSAPVRVWPHHFDTGSVIPVKIDKKGDLLKSVGIGLAVADGISNEHYFYVSPWSANNISFESLPDLGFNGKWHIQSWNGAYLPISEVYKATSKEEQIEIVNGFLISAIDACLYLLDSTGLFTEN